MQIRLLTDSQKCPTSSVRRVVSENIVLTHKSGMSTTFEQSDNAARLLNRSLARGDLMAMLSQDPEVITESSLLYHHFCLLRVFLILP